MDDNIPKIVGDILSSVAEASRQVRKDKERGERERGERLRKIQQLEEREESGRRAKLFGIMNRKRLEMEKEKEQSERRAKLYLIMEQRKLAQEKAKKERIMLLKELDKKRKDCIQKRIYRENEKVEKITKVIKKEEITEIIKKEDEPNESDKFNECSECCICMDNPIDTIVLPCGHYSYCDECAATMLHMDQICGICMTKIESKHRVYKS